ncbi:class I SAM-dependent methyltransferase [Sulfurovum sp.]|uniref:protein-L-isoaspartate O-methyltransferase family protein n=1 Tax=Sulfurovum sp. TaxID=1969726 RepID=UPI0025D0C30E|nr:class I SAM-dependent methyltransferase [Sulfurovum sp.]
MKNKEALVNAMITGGALRSPHIIKAFETIDRKYFVPEDFAEHIYVDAPLPIGKDQTISQPSTVAFMLELLGVQEGDRVLDIGSGSGWTTALLCAIVGGKGRVKGMERVDELVVQGQKNLAQFHFGSFCSIQKAGEHLGIPGETFDKILVSASADEIPEELFGQLKTGGVLVIPVRNSIFRFRKISPEQVSREEFPGFRFVPLIY